MTLTEVYKAFLLHCILPCSRFPLHGGSVLSCWDIYPRGREMFIASYGTLLVRITDVHQDMGEITKGIR